MNNAKILCPNLKNKKSLTSFFRVILRQYDNAFALPTTPVAQLVPGVTIPRYLLRVKSLFYTRKLKEWIILPLNYYQVNVFFYPLTYITF